MTGHSCDYNKLHSKSILYSSSFETRVNDYREYVYRLEGSYAAQNDLNTGKAGKVCAL